VKTKIKQAIVVEGRDDVTAVSEAVDALIIPTHGFGITAETWGVIAKAYEEKGIIILTDPDHAGEEIRRKLTGKFPEAIQAYVARDDATDADDIGIENARPETIAEALGKALARSGRTESTGDDNAADEAVYADMSDLTRLGLAGSEGASELRAEVAKALGIGYGNAGAFIKKLRGFGIRLDELKEEIEKIRKKD
jgi:ribonuclease M5